ncbi:MAG: hypothetical protein P9L92_16100 [Candidatus Electryonea clarkiae]|nr:hypothetical protein [Candidatus Electryonea clarkiae]MDP8285273.1 hypothetical protein [Candidatus Electryonea clarkiae]
MQKNEFNKIVDDGNWQALGQLLLDSPGQARRLISRLHTTSEPKLAATLDGFQITAKVFERERLLDLCRKLMWMLNEESANFCPNAALALGHIAQVDPEAVEPHLPSLQIHADDPSEMMRIPVRKGITLIRMALMKNRDK